jgi:hypothetical protein
MIPGKKEAPPFIQVGICRRLAGPFLFWHCTDRIRQPAALDLKKVKAFGLNIPGRFYG